MERYKNIGGNSGIYGYELRGDAIVVQFNDGSIYLYDSFRPGMSSVAHMKSLALRGCGLNSYISSVVRKQYARKIA